MAEENTETLTEEEQKSALEKALEKKKEAEPKYDENGKLIEKKPEEKLTPFNEHPDWKAMYGSQKRTERENVELKKDLAALKETMNTFNGSVSSMDDKLFDMKEVPDPIEDSKGYLEYSIAMAKRQIKKETVSKVKSKTEVKTELNSTNTTLNILETIEAGLHSDYHEMVNKYAVEDMQADKTLELTIMRSENAPRAAYEYAVKKKSTMEKSQQNIIDAGYVEGGVKPNEIPLTKEIKLSDAQKRSARLMGVSEEKFLLRYKEQLAIRK